MNDIMLEKKLLSLDDLLAMEQRVEIIDGEVIEVGGAGYMHHTVASNVYDILKPFVVQNELGVVHFDGLIYLMFSDAGGLKDSFQPDVSFIRKEDFIFDFDRDKPYPGVPTLAVEIVSPGDDAEKVQTKIRTYLEKGAEQVLVMYPSLREVHQYRRDNNPEIRIYHSGALDLDALFPGLELTIEMIFAMPAWMKKSDE